MTKTKETISMLRAEIDLKRYELQVLLYDDATTKEEKQAITFVTKSIISMRDELDAEINELT